MVPNTSSNNLLCESFVSKNANDISNGNIGITLSLNKQSDLTDAEVQAFKDLYTYSPTTVVSASSDQLTPYIEFELS